MNEENMTHKHACTHNGKLFNIEREGNPVICDNMVEPQRHNIK
jgi:hypothetical protein